MSRFVVVVVVFNDFCISCRWNQPVTGIFVQAHWCKKIVKLYETTQIQQIKRINEHQQQQETVVVFVLTKRLTIPISL